MSSVKKVTVKAKGKGKARVKNLAGRDIVFHPPQAAAPPPSFAVARRKVLPLTERAINLTAAIAGLVSFTGLGVIFTPLFRLMQSNGGALGTMLMFVIGVGMLVAVTGVWLGFVMRRDKYNLPNDPTFRAFRGISDPDGNGRRLALDRLTATCPVPSCGAEMLFYNRRGASTYVADGQGGAKEVLGARKPMMVCTENPDHDAHRIVFDITWKPDGERAPEQS